MHIRRRQYRRVNLFFASILVILPVYAFATPQMPPNSDGVRAVLLFAKCCIPIMPVLGSKVFGVIAWFQLPVILLCCVSVWMFFHRRKRGWGCQFLVIVLTYIIATMLTNWIAADYLRHVRYLRFRPVVQLATCGNHVAGYLWLSLLPARGTLVSPSGMVETPHLNPGDGTWNSLLNSERRPTSGIGSSEP
jgi:hypothetical protein